MLELLSFISLPGLVATDTATQTPIIPGISQYMTFGSGQAVILLGLVGMLGGALLIKKFAFNVPLSALKVLTGGGRRRRR